MRRSVSSALRRCFFTKKKDQITSTRDLTIDSEQETKKSRIADSELLFSPTSDTTRNSTPDLESGLIQDDSEINDDAEKENCSSLPVQSTLGEGDDLATDSNQQHVFYWVRLLSILWGFPLRWPTLVNIFLYDFCTWKQNNFGGDLSLIALSQPSTPPILCWFASSEHSFKLSTLKESRLVSPYSRLRCFFHPQSSLGVAVCHAKFSPASRR